MFFQHTLLTFSYQSVITFGGCRDDFIVVSSQQREPGVGKKSVEKLVFGMAKPKVDRSGYVLGLLSFIVQWFLNYGISTMWYFSRVPLYSLIVKTFWSFLF